jgi:hypothetical protein
MAKRPEVGQSSPMDLIFVVITVGCFVAAIGYTLACDRV